MRLMCYMVIKRLLDLVLSALFIIALLPVFLLIALLVKVTSPGPVFFRQQRLGQRGRVFTMLKFRSMVDKAETMGTGLFSYADDPRITPVGRFIRRMSLDEIPQFLNVFAGSMSIVGPRPAVTYELGDYAVLPAATLIRFEMKPGITGLAQVSGRNDLSWDDKIVLDTRYIRQFAKWGPLLDLLILARTPLVVLAMSNTIERKR